MTNFDGPTEIQPRAAHPVVRRRTAGIPVGSATPIRPAAPTDGPTVVISPADGPTALIAAVPELTPVFVDPSGRRHSRLRWLAYTLGLVGLVYTGLVGVSFAGGIEPHTVLPFVDEVEQPERSSSPQAEALTTTATTPAAAAAVPTTVATRTPRASAPAVVPATPSPAVSPTATPSRSPSATRSPSRSPATSSTSPRPTRTVPEATTPDPPDPTGEPPALPDLLSGRVDDARADG
ncbi:hypothetical protein [Micromonospora sp. NBC_00421]|uniref:hypothetical protein n=1 Tax=Micromonospora sp. NBC_00421 TaxID=2975976 RepID=UPI002E23A383